MSFRGGRGGGRGGFSARGGRGGSFAAGPPAQVLPFGSFKHAVEGDMLCASSDPKHVPYFNAPILYVRSNSGARLTAQPREQVPGRQGRRDPRSDQRGVLHRQDGPRCRRHLIQGRGQGVYLERPASAHRALPPEAQGGYQGYVQRARTLLLTPTGPKKRGAGRGGPPARGGRGGGRGGFGGRGGGRGGGFGARGAPRGGRGGFRGGGFRGRGR